VVLKKTSKDLFLTANDISEITGMSAQYAYRLIKQLNEELKDQNFIVINGRVSKKYFEERFYGMKGDLNGSG
jgi:hypothetical protein